MPSSAVRTFSDPDDYAASIRGTSAEMTVIGRGHFEAKLTQIELHRLRMQRFYDNLPRVAHSAAVTGRAIVNFRIRPGPSMLANGVELKPTSIMRHSDGLDAFQRSSGCAYWGSISLPVEAVASAGATLGGCDLAPPKDPLTVTPTLCAMAKLQRLHAAAGVLAEDTPEIIAHPEAAYGLEQALIEALVGCLSGGEAGEDKSAQRRHSLIMRRFRRVVEENPDRALYIPELAAEIGVSLSTLRVCCEEQLGMSPKRYLMLRRMHFVRRALLDNAPGTSTVTNIATRYGFFELGRFSGQYGSLFGESPSATLRRKRDSGVTGPSDFPNFC
jgi:AraC-like DNA-binding protein